MGKKTDYQRLWKREQETNRKLWEEIQRLKDINEAQIDVLRRVRDGELIPKEIFSDEKISPEVKVEEHIRQTKKEIQK